MFDLKPRYSKEEFSRRGQKIYERSIRPLIKSDDIGKFVAIDIETEKYEMVSDDYTAVERLLSQNPDAQSWLVRVGEQAAYRTGRRRLGP